MLYYKAPIGVKEIGKFLYFSGANDYLISSNISSPASFSLWQRTQPWTFFIKARQDKTTGNCYFSSKAFVGAGGYNIGQNGTSDFYVKILGRPSPAPEAFNKIEVKFPFSYTGDFIIQVTYDGSSSASGVFVYLNGVLQTLTVVKDFLGTNISPLTNTFALGSEIPNTGVNSLQGIIYNMSFVDYVKSGLELTQDFTNQEQEIGTGAWLISPIIPSYNIDGTEQIKTLTTADINSPAPGCSFLNSQGHRLTLGGFPDPLVVGIDII